MPRPRVHDDELRVRLLDRAVAVVGEAGVAALSLRSLATAEDTSTSAVYSLFGGKPGLLAALFEEAFSSFGDAQRAVPVGTDPMSDLIALGASYWDWAMTHPLLYGVMFGGALAGFTPDAEQGARAAATIDPLASAVGRAVAAGFLVGNVDIITMSIWAGVHGVVSLELAHCSPYDRMDPRALFDSASRAVLQGFSPGSASAASPTLRSRRK